MNYFLPLVLVVTGLGLAGCSYTGCEVEVGSDRTEVCIDSTRSAEFCERELDGIGIESDSPLHEEGIICSAFGYEVKCAGVIQRRGTPQLSFGYWAKSEDDCAAALDEEIIID